MCNVDFKLERDIEVSPSALHRFLCDLNNYTPLHPLIESIEELEPSRELPLAKRYRVVDRISFGPFKLRTVYIAALDPVAEDEVHGYAWQFPSIRLHTIYSLTRIAIGTHLEERVCVEAPWLLRRFVIEQARRAHAETLVKMGILLETTP
jgi:hypothetical protein